MKLSEDETVKTDVIQQYGVAARENNLRVFIINRRGEIFTVDRAKNRGWIQVAGPSKPKKTKP